MIAPLAIADFQWSGSAFVSSEYDDNVTRVSTNKESDVLSVLGTNFTVDLKNSPHYGKADYRLERTTHSKGSFDDETLLTGSLSTRFMLRPNTIFWSLNHTQELTVTDASLNVTPDNTEQRSVISTGPEIVVHPTNRDRFSASSTFKITELENSNNNSDEIRHSLKWSHQISTLTSSNIVYNYSDVRFDSDKDLNYEKNSILVGLSGQRVYFDYRVAVGSNEVTQSTDESLTDVSYSLDLSKSHHGLVYSLGAKRELSDTSNATTLSDQTGQQSGISGSLPVSNVGVVSVVEQTSLFANITGMDFTPRIRGNFSVARTESKSKDDLDVDETSTKVTFNLNYQMSTRLQWFSIIQIAQDEISSRDDDTKVLTLGSRYSTPGGLSVGLGLGYEQQDSSDSQFEYDSLTANVKVSYSFGSEY